MTPRPPHLAEPGMYHGPIDGRPRAGEAVLANSVPEVRLNLGQIAGRDVELTVSDPAWLDELEEAARVARARLCMFGGSYRGDGEWLAGWHQWRAGQDGAACVPRPTAPRS